MDKREEAELKELLLQAENCYHRIGDIVGSITADDELTDVQEQLYTHGEDVYDGMESTFENWSASAL